MINKNIDGRKSRSNKKKEFQNSWSITYRKPNYDALGDPHASYYFLNKSMRKHLTSLKKSIEKEGAFVQKRKIRYMISERIRDFDNDSRATKVQAYHFKMKSSPSISSLGSIKSRKELLNEETQRNDKLVENKQEIQKKIEQQITEKSKTLQVQPHTKREKQKAKRLNLPKIAVQNKKTVEQYQNDKLERQVNKITMYNKTEHNKFLKFLIQRKKKLSCQKKQKKQNQRTNEQSKQLQNNKLG